MKLYHILLAFALLAVLTACQPEEITVNQPYNDWKLLAITHEPAQLTIIDQPENRILQQDAYAAANGTPLPDSVASAVAFRDTLYLFMPQRYTIEVVARFAGYKRVTTLDFSDKKLMPTSIAFPNATTGYIAFSNANAVGVIDITQLPTGDMKKIFIATIPVGGTPVSITALGNKLLTANRDDNTVSVIDSRTNQVVKTLFVHAAPLFIQTDADGNEAVLLSAGAGKFSDDGPQTACQAQFINATSLAVVRSFTVFDRAQDSLGVVPTGLVITRDEYAFIPVQTALIALNTRERQNSMRSLDRKEYHSVFHNPLRNEVIALNAADRRTTLFTGRGGKLGTLTLPVQSGILLPQ